MYSDVDAELQRTGTYELTRVQSTRLRETGGPLESTTLRTGIVSNLEQPDQKHRRVIGFLPDDPENPHNWTNVSLYINPQNAPTYILTNKCVGTKMGHYDHTSPHRLKLHLQLLNYLGGYAVH